MYLRIALFFRKPEKIRILFHLAKKKKTTLYIIIHQYTLEILQMEEQWNNAISFDGHPNDNIRNSISLLIVVLPSILKNILPNKRCILPGKELQVLA